MTHPPTLDEVLRAIWKLKNGRAAGSDGIQPELLKYAEEPVSISLHTLFTRVWKTGLVPAEWHEGIIVSLYKGKGHISTVAGKEGSTVSSIICDRWLILS